jgi:serine/threonine protein kinase
MASVRHPNIVLFIGACTKPPNLCIVLEYCPRGSLWGVLRDPGMKFSFEEKVRVALDTAKGVNYLHHFSTPVIHRDLKSLNILLDTSCTSKISDFGWTRFTADSMTNRIGTYQWMAPEVIMGNRYTESADVYSFGIILWELISEKPPYRELNAIQVSDAVAKKDIRPPVPKGGHEGWK